MRILFLAFPLVLLLQSCLSDSKSENHQYIISLSTAPKVPGDNAYVKDIESNDSVWVHTFRKLDGTYDVETPEKFAEYLQKVVTGRFSKVTRKGQEKASDEFDITAELRDTVLAANPQRDGIDSLLIKSNTIGDFAPIKKGNSWTYVDSSVSCDGYPVHCTVYSIDTLTYTIADVYTSTDTLFYSIVTTSARGTGTPETCYESGDSIMYYFPNITVPCVPLFYVHHAQYTATNASLFSKSEVLGKNTLVYLVGSGGSDPYSGIHYDSIFVAKDIGAIKFMGSFFAGPHTSSTFLFHLISTNLR